MLQSPQLLLDQENTISPHSLCSPFWLRAPERKINQRLFFLQQCSQSEQQLEITTHNRNRIKDNFKRNLSIILQKPQESTELNEDFQTLLQDEMKRKSKRVSISIENLSRKLDLELSYFQSEKIILDVTQYFDKYEVLNTLGEGCIGLVKRVRNRQTGEYFAVKMVATTDEEIIRNMLIEFNNLIKLSHENIVKMHELYINYDDSFQSESRAYIIMDFIDGKEMFEVINHLGHYSEMDAKLLFKQLLSAIEFLHRHGVCHRDLKPNNILCVKGTIQKLCEDSKQIKITDFNVSKFSETYKEFGDLQDLEKIDMWTYTGTVAFSAPEIFTGEGYSQMVDMWSAGCILYSMLSGSLPFTSEYLNDLVEDIKKAEFTFPQDQFQSISSQAKDLITQLLQKEPQNRLYPDQALQHPWFNSQQLERRQTLNNLTIKAHIHQLTSNHTRVSRQRLILKNLEKIENPLKLRLTLSATISNDCQQKQKSPTKRTYLQNTQYSFSEELIISDDRGQIIFLD